MRQFLSRGFLPREGALLPCGALRSQQVLYAEFTVAPKTLSCA